MRIFKNIRTCLNLRLLEISLPEILDIEKC